MASLFKEMKADALMADADKVAVDTELDSAAKSAKFDEIEKKIDEVITDAAEREAYFAKKQEQREKDAAAKTKFLEEYLEKADAATLAATIEAAKEVQK